MTDTNKNQVAVQQQNQIKEFFAAPSVTQKFKELLGTKAQGFVTTVLQIAAGNEQLRSCLPKTIFTAAAVAATMDLPINPNLGFAYIVPYKGQAQFQMGYKGFVQLAMRTGQYLRLNVIEVYENQFKSWNELTEELEADFSIAGNGQIVGYCSYFKLINGFEKTVYWTLRRVQEHAAKYSKNFTSDKSIWKTDFTSMALKTVLKSNLSRWGILSVEMQKAIVADQAVVNDADGTDFTYVDSTSDEEQGETGENKSKAAIDATMKLMDKGNKQQ